MAEWRHLCIDMQRMFSDDTPWNVPWMPRVMPQVLDIVSRYPEQTVFTRFIPPQTAAEAPGMWKDYYEKWSMMTREQIDRSYYTSCRNSIALRRPPACLTRWYIRHGWTAGSMLIFRRHVYRRW